MPKHVSNIIEMTGEESVIAAIPAYDFNTEANVVIATRNGMIKRSKLKEFKLQRYSKATSCMNLKDDDEVITAFVEKDKYIREGVHKGMQGWICSEQRVPGRWLVNFPQCGDKDDIAEISIKEEDLRIVEILDAQMNEQIKAKFEKSENSAKMFSDTPDDI